MESCKEYFSLLREIGKTLEQLTGTAGEKADAVRQDDLAALDDVLKREQALSLALRGCEQKRARMLAGLGLEGTALSELASRVPAEYRLEAKAAVDTLQRQYQIYHSAADTARCILECNLHQIEKALSGTQSPAVGYASIPSAAEPPAPMKTDFRA